MTTPQSPAKQYVLQPGAPAMLVWQAPGASLLVFNDNTDSDDTVLLSNTSNPVNGTPVTGLASVQWQCDNQFGYCYAQCSPSTTHAVTLIVSPSASNPTLSPAMIAEQIATKGIPSVILEDLLYTGDPDDMPALDISKYASYIVVATTPPTQSSQLGVSFTTMQSAADGTTLSYDTMQTPYSSIGATATKTYAVIGTVLTAGSATIDGEVVTVYGTNRTFNNLRETSSGCALFQGTAASVSTYDFIFLYPTLDSQYSPVPYGLCQVDMWISSTNRPGLGIFQVGNTINFGANPRIVTLGSTGLHDFTTRMPADSCLQYCSRQVVLPESYDTIYFQSAYVDPNEVDVTVFISQLTN